MKSQSEFNTAVLCAYADYYNRTRTRLSLDKDSPGTMMINALRRRSGRAYLDPVASSSARF